MTQKNNTKVRITITILPVMNSMLEKVSKQSGQSKSSLVERAVKDLLSKKLVDDSKILSNLNFDDTPDENQWLEIQSKF